MPRRHQRTLLPAIAPAPSAQCSSRRRRRLRPLCISYQDRLGSGLPMEGEGWRIENTKQYTDTLLVERIE